MGLCQKVKFEGKLFRCGRRPGHYLEDGAEIFINITITVYNKLITRMFVFGPPKNKLV